MRILIIHNEYAQRSGEAIAVELQEKLLLDYGHDVRVFRAQNQEIENFSFLQKLSLISNTIYSRRAAEQLHHTIQDFGPQIAHGHNVFPLLSPAVYDTLHHHKLPFVQTVHNYRFMCTSANFLTPDNQICERCASGNFIPSAMLGCYRNSRLQSAILATSLWFHRRNATFSKIPHFICLNSFARDKLVQHQIAKAQNITILPNFTEPPPKPPDKKKPTSPYILYLGRLSPEKGVANLVSAMKAAPETKLLLAGDGPAAKELNGIIKKENIKNITMLGFVDTNQKWSLLRSATATIHPSFWYENQPYSILESLSVGTPLLLSNIGALPTLAGDHSIEFNPNSTSEITRAIRQLIKRAQSSTNMQTAALKYYNENFTPTAHYTALIDLYTNISHL